jgi:hypothetical protein
VTTNDETPALLSFFKKKMKFCFFLFFSLCVLAAAENGKVIKEYFTVCSKRTSSPADISMNILTIYKMGEPLPLIYVDFISCLPIGRIFYFLYFFSCQLKGKIRDTTTSFSIVEKVTQKVFPVIKSLLQTEAFRYFKVLSQDNV